MHVVVETERASRSALSPTAILDGREPKPLLRSQAYGQRSVRRSDHGASAGADLASVIDGVGRRLVVGGDGDAAPTERWDVLDDDFEVDRRGLRDHLEACVVLRRDQPCRCAIDREAGLDESGEYRGVEVLDVSGKTQRRKAIEGNANDVGTRVRGRVEDGNVEPF